MLLVYTPPLFFFKMIIWLHSAVILLLIIRLAFLTLILWRIFFFWWTYTCQLLHVLINLFISNISWNFLVSVFRRRCTCVRNLLEDKESRNQSRWVVFLVNNWFCWGSSKLPAQIDLFIMYFLRHLRHGLSSLSIFKEFGHILGCYALYLLFSVPGGHSRNWGLVHARHWNRRLWNRWLWRLPNWDFRLRSRNID